MNAITQVVIRHFQPFWNGLITRLVYAGRRVSIGRGFRADSVPRIIVDRGCKVVIEDGVEFRRGVEIRAHGTSRILILSNSRIDRGVRILAANKSTIKIGQGTRIGLYSVLNGGDSISIGKKTLISGFVYLQTSMHRYRGKGAAVQDQGYDHAPIALEDDTWLGTHVVILPGVTVCKGSIVGSNAVVTSTVASYTVVAGIPAKPIKVRA